MVFCGKPSKGCASCRKRRIKVNASHTYCVASVQHCPSSLNLRNLTTSQCDQLDPECTQCKRAGKKCSGYRDQLALMFRDENEKVVQKASTTAKKRQVSRKVQISNKFDDASSTSDSFDFVRTSQEDSFAVSPAHSDLSLTSRELTPLCPPMPLCFDDLGINFFFNHYATITSKSSSIQINAALSPIWTGLSANPMFHDAISSVGFAGLSNVSQNYKHMEVARRKYVTTLGRTNAALQNPDVDPAHIFTAVLLLALFEVCLLFSSTLRILS